MIIFTSIFPAYVLSGFKKWKKALEQFSSLEKSNCHKTAVTTCMYMKTDHLKHSCVVIRHHSKRNHEYVFEKPRACHWCYAAVDKARPLEGMMIVKEIFISSWNTRQKKIPVLGSGCHVERTSTLLLKFWMSSWICWAILSSEISHII